MTFSIRKNNPPDNLKIAHNYKNQSHVISKATTTKYLGVIIDEGFKRSDQIKAIVNKTRYLTYVFPKLKKIFDSNNLKLIYNAFFGSIVNYGIVAWGNAYDNIFQLLENLQTRLLKLIYGKKFYDTCLSTTLPKVRQLYYYNALLHDYETLEIQFLQSKSITRSKQISLNKHKLEFGKKSYKYTAVRIYNNLLNNYKTLDVSKTLMKKKFRNWITQKINYKL